MTDQPEAEGVRDTDPRLRQLNDLRAGNAARHQKLTAGGVSLNAPAVLQVRLETLLDLILGQDARLTYELEFEQRISAMLEEGQRQLVRQTLTAGIHPPNGHRPA